MKRTKRQENSIVFQFVFNLILIVGFLILIIAYVLPKIIEISEIKTSAIEKNNELTELNVKGLTFGEFRVESRKKLQKSENIYLKEILEDLDEKFYNEHFVNNSGSFEDFLAEKIQEYSDLSDLEKKESQIQDILPIYSEKIDDISDNQLSDYKFINYIERLLETFNLEYKNFIGINKTVSIEKFNTSIDNSLESGIYYIPLTLDITGSKRNLLGFLYFIENVGNITVSGKDISIDNENKYIKNKILDGDKRSFDYNIFNNQLADIKNISYKDDFDSSFTDEVGDNDFVTYLMTYQGNEKFNIRVDLNFYVRGLPSYKIEEYIEKVIIDFKDLQKLLAKELKNTNYSDIQKDILLSHNNTIKLFIKDINNIEKLMKKGDELEKLYDRSSNYKNVVNDILVDLEKQLGITMK